MNRILTVLLVIFFSVCDIAVSTVLYCHGNECYLHFSVSLSEYSFVRSVFDIWLASLVRGAICLGMVIALICNPTDTISRAKIWCYIPVLISGTIIIFNLVKLLGISEVEDNLSDPWFWGIFSSTIIFSVLISTNWLLISRTTLPGRLAFLVNNNDGRETEPLLHKTSENMDKNSRGKNKDRKKQKGSILRLLKMSSPDLLFVITAFIFLVISSTGM